jgi:ribose transport system ATP-binding protein
MVEKQILKMTNISKDFPGVQALDGVHFNVYEGEVMALIGENGAGKSTLMKILTGVYPKSGGEILYRKKVVDFKNVKESQLAGLAIIHQELNLVEELSIAENIFLGREPGKGLVAIDKKKMIEDAKALLTKLNIDEDPVRLVKHLSIGKKQMVEIAKALSLEAQLIIMDEPTDALTDKESASLFEVIDTLRRQGKSIVYISHRLKEIFEVCDRVTVLRDGHFVAEKPVAQIDQDELIEMMVGRKLEEQYPYLFNPRGELLLSVSGLENSFVRQASLDVYAGEIVGVAGLMGAGRTELAKTIFGVYPFKKGQLSWLGDETIFHSAAAAIRAGLVYVSEDRKKDGLVLSMSVKENISLSSLKQLCRYKVIRGKKELARVKEFISRLSIKTPSERQLVKNLSGGNQQKVSIARSLMTRPRVLILDEPTRGVDVGAKKEIYNLMNQFKADGMGILMISSEIPELLGMCDRILVMHEGAMLGEIPRENATQEAIMRYAVGIKEAGHEARI